MGLADGLGVGWERKRQNDSKDFCLGNREASMGLYGDGKIGEGVPGSIETGIPFWMG